MSRLRQEKKTRKKVEMLYRKYRAVMILINALSPEELERTNRSLERISTADIEEVKMHLPKIEKETEALFERFGVVGDLDDLEDALSFDPDNTYPIAFITKAYLEQLFEHYERRLPNFLLAPPHALIGIERFGVDDDLKGQFEIFLLEASLFEDMACLWNMTLALQQELLVKYSKEKKKQLSSLSRATVKAVFGFLEGYLNSLALDILITHNLTPEQETLLTEWDSERDRGKFLKLRDKLLQYPKLATGVEHPPIAESNCPELERIVELEAKIRHSLIHPTPQIVGRFPDIHRVQIYMNIEVNEVRELCDSTIALVRRIDTEINGMFGDIGLWLFDRGEDGYFPDNVFC